VGKNLVGTTIGNIRIDAMLGAGGMGEVYRGFDTRLERRVAVKTIRADQLLEPDVKARFLREARILSRIEHPSICQVYDLVEGGETDYLIFEYVEGKTLEQVAASRQLSEREVLEVGEKIARGLAAAHRERIVHRDLKPGNVMIASNGAVKILDFGISRAVKGAGEHDTGAADGSGISADDFVTGRHALEGATVRMPADGHSVVLAGPGTLRMPSTASEADGATARLATNLAPNLATNELPLRDGATVRLPLDPSSPGFGMTTLDADLTQYGYLIGTVHFMSPEQASGREITEASDLYSLGILLQELLTGEPAYRTDTVRSLLPDVAAARTLPIRGVDPDIASLVTSLESPEPTARPTAEQAATAMRFILDKPIRLRRQRLVRWATVAGVTLLAVVTVVVSVLAVKASREAARAAAEARRAQETASILLDLFREAGPDAEHGADLTVRALVDKSATHFEHDLADKPLLRANMQDTLGLIYSQLARFDEAEALVRKALETRLALLAPEHPDIARSRQQLAAIEAERGHFEEASTLLTQAIASFERGGDGEAEGLAGALNDLAALESEQGRFEAAMPLYRRSLAAQERLYGKSSERLTGVLNNLAVLTWQQGDTAEAQRLYERCLRISEATTGPNDKSLISVLNNLGILYRQQGNLAAAAPLHQRALAIAEKSLGPDVAEVANILYSQGRLATESGDLAAAQAAFERSLAIQTKVRGASHYEAARCQVQLAEIQRRRGDFPSATARIDRAVTDLAAAVGEEHPSTLEALQVAADVRRDGGDQAAARELYARAAKVAAALYGDDDERTRKLLQAAGSSTPTQLSKGR
jgi:serine/threonine protein kinase/Tfp pilus assembly protein PilF